MARPRADVPATAAAIQVGIQVLARPRILAIDASTPALRRARGPAVARIRAIRISRRADADVVAATRPCRRAAPARQRASATIRDRAAVLALRRTRRRAATDVPGGAGLA